jgi:hypothetical protein
MIFGSTTARTHTNHLRKGEGEGGETQEERVGVLHMNGTVGYEKGTRLPKGKGVTIWGGDPTKVLSLFAAAILLCLILNIWLVYSVYSAHYLNAQRLGFQMSVDKQVLVQSKSFFHTGGFKTGSKGKQNEDNDDNAGAYAQVVASIAFQQVVEDLIEKVDDLGQTLRLVVHDAAQNSLAVTRHSIGLITPVTSKGYKSNPELMPLFKVSLTSLCNTATASYHYTYFLCYTEGDPIFTNNSLIHELFNHTREKCDRWNVNNLQIDFVLVPAGPRVTAKRGLSILFNLPTLVAYARGYEYFYLINDDLRFVTKFWTDKFVYSLVTSSVFPNFGITGGLDVSSPQPFLEFPFFHRTHIEILGDEAPAHPYLFHNWWEDNWMNDLYLPWNSSFYLTDVIVCNYAGLQYGVKEDGTPIEPKRYESLHNVPPVFYINEVERGRRKILHWLQTHLPEEEAGYNQELRQLVLGVEVEYCKNEGETLTYSKDKDVNPCLTTLV